MKTKTQTLLNAAFFLMGILLLSSCKQGDNSRFLADSFGITVSPNPGVLGEEVKVSTGSGFRNYSWTLTYESGTVSKDFPNAAEFSFLPQEAGAAVLTVELEDSEHVITKSEVKFSIIDPAALANQGPRIDVKAMVNNSVVARFNSDASLDIVPLNVETGTLKFDMSGTTDENSTLAEMKFEMNVDNAGYQVVEPITEKTFSTVKANPISVRVTDAMGKASTISFTAFIKCSASTFPALSLTGLDVNVSAAGTKNFFNYAISGSPSGGKGPFKYAFDFNGDGVFDSDFASATSVQAYSIYKGNRDIGISAWDTGCNYFATTTRLKNLQMSWFPVFTEDASYYYIQSDIRPVDSDVAIGKLENVDVIVSQLQAGPATPQRIKCDYRKQVTSTSNTQGSSKATFTIEGSNIYSRTLDPHAHGIWLSISNIDDTCGTSLGCSITTTNARIDDALYFTDGGQDQSAWMNYWMHEACTLNLRVEPIQAVVPCATSGSSHTYGTRITGRFHCPDMLQQGGTHHLNMGENQGAFYCEVQEIDACVGGGGGGGGGVPPRPR